MCLNYKHNKWLILLHDSWPALDLWCPILNHKTDDLRTQLIQSTRLLSSMWTRLLFAFLRSNYRRPKRRLWTRLRLYSRRTLVCCVYCDQTFIMHKRRLYALYQAVAVKILNEKVNYHLTHQQPHVEAGAELCAVCSSWLYLVVLYRYMFKNEYYIYNIYTYV